tara:strand:+ start:75 stop:692 length:618 start_codon:yes stop_codon:yes gene_type:complete
MKTKSYLIVWFAFAISIFILNESKFIHFNNSSLFAQELKTSLVLKKGNNWIEMNQGDKLYIRSYKAGALRKGKPNKLPSSTLGSFVATKPSTLVGIDSQNRILVTDIDYIYLSDIYSISIISSKTMAWKFAANNFGQAFLAGIIIPMTVFLTEDTDGFVLGLILSAMFGIVVAVPSALLGLIHGYSYPNIENEYIIGSNNWIIVE